MIRESVSSSNIQEIGYDPDTRALEVLFSTGIVYQYFEVPEALFREMRASSSVGQYLNANIKGNFRYARV